MDIFLWYLSTLSICCWGLFRPKARIVVLRFPRLSPVLCQWRRKNHSCELRVFVLISRSGRWPSMSWHSSWDIAAGDGQEELGFDFCIYYPFLLRYRDCLQTMKLHSGFLLRGLSSVSLTLIVQGYQSGWHKRGKRFTLMPDQPCLCPLCCLQIFQLLDQEAKLKISSLEEVSKTTIKAQIGLQHS